jgi:hypothetical protein
MSEVLRVALVAFGFVIGTWSLLLLASWVFSIVCLLFCSSYSMKRVEDRVHSIEEAVTACRESGLTGWELVEYAQKLVAHEMPEYGYCNSFDFPAKAFKRGRGYCWQRSGALKLILEDLGFIVWTVHAFVNRFPNGLTSGHVWLRVRIGEETKDVCPGNASNIPGAVHFESITKVKEWGPGIFLLSYLGVPIVNMIASFAHWMKRNPASR